MSQPDQAPLSPDERAELLRLRAQVATLTQPLPSAQRDHPRGQRSRWTGAIVLLALAALLAPLSALATFTRATILDTERYVATITPLAADPAVQQEATIRITDAIFEALRVEELTATTLEAIGDRPRVEGVTENLPVELETFAQPISTAIYDFTSDQVSRLVASPQFQDAWVAANREAHESLVAALTGETSDAGVTVTDGQVSVSLAAFITAIKPVLIERGVPFAERIPEVQAEFVILESAALEQAQTAVRVLDLLRVVLPVTAVLLLLAGVALAPDRRRALVIGSSMIVGTLVVLLLAVQALRALYLGELEAALEVPEAAAVLFDVVGTPLRGWVRSSAALFLVIALAAWLAGPSGPATALRAAPGRLAGATRRPTGAVGRVATFVADNVTALRATTGGLAVLAVLAGERPGAGTVLLIAVLVALALVTLEVLRRWGTAAVDHATPV